MGEDKKETLVVPLEERGGPKSIIYLKSTGPFVIRYAQTIVKRANAQGRAISFTDLDSAIKRKFPFLVKDLFQETICRRQPYEEHHQIEERWIIGMTYEYDDDRVYPFDPSDYVPF